MANWRAEGYKRIQNSKCLEIGALNSPAKLDQSNTVDYLDCDTAENLRKTFPDATGNFVEPKFIVDLFKESIPFDAEYDCVIINHVIEHMKDPIGVLEECFNTLKSGGKLVVSCPDYRYTFDKNRKLTPFGVLYQNALDEDRVPVESDYLNFVLGVSKELANHRGSTLEERLKESLERKEHIYTYSSESFRELLLFLQKSGLNITPVYESFSSENNFEYFGIWEIQK